MDNLYRLEAIIERHEEGDEELDADQLFGMLKACATGLEECDAEGAAAQAIEIAGYSLR